MCILLIINNCMRGVWECEQLHGLCRISTQKFTILHPSTQFKMQIKGFLPFPQANHYGIILKVSGQNQRNSSHQDSENENNEFNQQGDRSRRKQIRLQNYQRPPRLNTPRIPQLQQQLNMHLMQANRMRNWRNRNNMLDIEPNPNDNLVLEKNSKYKLGEYLIEARWTEASQMKQIDLNGEVIKNLELLKWTSLNIRSYNCNIYPLQGREILFINQAHKFMNRSITNLLNLDTEQYKEFQGTNFQPISYKNKNPLFFQSSKIICQINFDQDQMFEYFKLEYKKFQFSGKKIQEKGEVLNQLVIQIDERERQFKFCKGNDESTVIWYLNQETNLSEYVCKIQFYHCKLSSSQVCRVVCDWPKQFGNSERVHIKSIIEMKENKFLLFLQSRIMRKTIVEKLFIYERSTNKLRLFHCPYQPLYKMNTCLPGVIRLIFKALNKSKQDYLVYYISPDEKVLAEDTWRSTTVRSPYLSKSLIEADKTTDQKGLQIVHKSVHLDLPFATVFLLQSVIREQTCDDLVCQSLQLLGLF